jgi:hypothetical protein
MRRPEESSSSPRWAGNRIASGLLVVALLGCEGLVDAENPEVITTDGLQDEVGLGTLYAGALGDFNLAWTGAPYSVIGQVALGGLLSDELMYSGESYYTLLEMDQRNTPVEESWLAATFDWLQRARRALEVAAEEITLRSPDAPTDARIGEMYSLAGFTYLAFGEDYCSGVPFGVAPTSGELQHGAPNTTTEIFTIAVERFDQALANTGGSDAMAHLTSLGKARALVNLGLFDDAAAEVATVPTTFDHVLEHSTNSRREQNGIRYWNADWELLSMADGEGGVGLPYRTAADIRTPWIRPDGGTDVGADGVTPQYELLKYPDLTAPVILADGIEARLIEAEALLNAGDATGWLATLNQLRADSGMTALADPGTDDGRVDLLFSERAFWLFATGHRLGDMRRLIRQYGRDPESVFPTGTYFRGGVYGPDVNLPVPQLEQVQNPNFDGCLNREA